MSTTAHDPARARPPGFLRTLWLLLGTARRRARGRSKRQAAMLRQRTGRRTKSFGALGFIVTALLFAGLNVGAGFATISAVNGAEQVVIESHGRMVVDAWFARRVRATETDFAEGGRSQAETERALWPSCRAEAFQIAKRRQSNDGAAIARQLYATLHQTGSAGFVVAPSIVAGFRALPTAGAMPAVMGSLVLIWWSIMLVFQGEGLELDIQRRRHPVWEWLLSHPVPIGAVFMAEMLGPLAANPLFLSAPLFAGVLYGAIYTPTLGVAAVALVGLPVTIAASCLGKALEIAVMLRFPARSRGGVIGLMSWLGYAAMMLFFLAAFAPYGIYQAAFGVMRHVGAAPWPFLGAFLGQYGQSFSFTRGVLACDAGALVTIAGAVSFSVWGAERGLTAPAESAAAKRVRAASFGKNALFRKELLWFARDRSAIVQAVLVPITLAGFQLFNLRNFASHAQGAWNTLSGAAILFGTYFLWVLGPKSLASEGAALWMATTWPHGLEALLRAKARLWTLLSSSMVALVLCYAIYLFPGDWWKVLLVGAGWFLFARSMAAKSVTLAVVTSESGEPTPVPRGRRMAAQLGMLTFCIGVFTQRVDLAVTGIVYSMMTAAAMWQNFRARLPYLFDPWSETLPAPPTLMHAMIAISILVEAGAIFTGGSRALASNSVAAPVMVVAYGVCAAAVSLGMLWFLRGRGVSLANIWFWPASGGGLARPARYASAAFVLPFLAAMVAAAVLGLGADLYVWVVGHLPVVAVQLEKSRNAMQAIPHLREAMFAIAVFIAPFSEEFLFRGLLYRALDREWGGWRAILGSAAFFASYHPVLSWLPVFLLGALNAVMFKRTGRLGPAILTHMTYNAVVLM